MLRHNARLSKASNEVIVHSSVIYSLEEGKISHISIEFEGQWVHSFNNVDEIEMSARNMKTKSGSRLLMYILEVPTDAILKTAQNSFYISRDGVGLKLGNTDANVVKTTRLRKK